MAWEENSRICLHMQLIAFLSRIGVSILKSESVQEQIANATNRVGVPKLALHRIENILVRIPSMEEQNVAVAHILKIRKNIDAAKNVAESCASRKQAIFDKYLK